jgi:enediyne biosynthesis protein CalE5
MSPKTPPVSEIKQQQRLDWDSAAAGWKQWWPVFEQAAQHVSNRLVEMAGVQSGSRVADLATGIGEPAITAARRAGAGGRVIAIDHSQGMLAVARERAASLGLANMDFVVGDIESLQAEPHSFDAAVCRWGLMFVPDLDAAARGIRQALKPGARFATAVWSAPDKVPMISLGADAVRILAGLPPRQPGALDPFRLADTSILTRALENAGFTDIRTEQLEVVFEFRSADEFTRFRADVSSPFRAVLNEAAPEQREKILRATSEAATPYRLDDGSLRLSNLTICVVAQA